MPDLNSDQFAGGPVSRRYDTPMAQRFRGVNQQQELFDSYGYGEESPQGLSKREIESAQAETHAVTVRAPDEALPGILSKGEFLSQHDTGRSSGVLDPDRRTEWEEEAGFNRPPVYGTLEPSGGGRSTVETELSDQYGSARFEMKRGVRSQTSILRGDSLDTRYTPASLADVTAGAELPGERVTNEFGEEEPDFTEAQIEPVEGKRGIPLSDVRSLTFEDTGEGVDPGIAQEFEAKGVPTRIREMGQVYQPPLPMSDEELSGQGFSDEFGGKRLRFGSQFSSGGPENLSHVTRSFSPQQFAERQRNR